MTMMTEDEAKTKWCPFFRSAIAVRPGDDLEHSINRSDIRRPDNAPSDACLASQCMAWRTEPAMEYHGPFAEADAYPPPGDGWTLCTRIETDVRTLAPIRKVHWQRTILNNSGYCGLAGKGGT